MRIGSFTFSPRLWPSLITLALLPVLISLGFWQLSRTEEKRQILTQQQEKKQLPQLTIDAQERTQQEVEYRRLIVTGNYIPEYQVLIDNKVYQGQVGYYIVTPLKIVNSDKVILINRGWVKATHSRDVLPDIETPQGQVTLTGVAKYRPKDVASLGSGNRLGNAWPALVRWIDIDKLAEDMRLNLKSYLFLQDKLPEDQYKREWVFVNSPPEKNFSYAVQWFSLATALLLIYIFVNTKRSKEQE